MLHLHLQSTHLVECFGIVEHELEVCCKLLYISVIV